MRLGKVSEVEKGLGEFRKEGKEGMSPGFVPIESGQLPASLLLIIPLKSVNVCENYW